MFGFQPLGSNIMPINGGTYCLVGPMCIVFMGFHVYFLDELEIDVEPHRWMELGP